MQNVTSFENACEILGINPQVSPATEGMPEDIAKTTIAFYKLSIIYKATVGNWKPDYSKSNQWKRTPWLNWVPSLSAFVFTDAYYAVTIAGLGARFVFPDTNTGEAHAKYFATQHIGLINQLHTY